MIYRGMNTEKFKQVGTKRFNQDLGELLKKLSDEDERHVGDPKRDRNARKLTEMLDLFVTPEKTKLSRSYPVVHDCYGIPILARLNTLVSYSYAVDYKEDYPGTHKELIERSLKNITCELERVGESPSAPIVQFLANEARYNIKIATPYGCTRFGRYHIEDRWKTYGSLEIKKEVLPDGVKYSFTLEFKPPFEILDERTYLVNQFAWYKKQNVEIEVGKNSEGVMRAKIDDNNLLGKEQFKFILNETS